MELHAANGYLIDEFLQSRTNHRADSYGGSLENRYRFLDEIVRSISRVWATDRIGVHISPNGIYNDMGSPDFRETFLYVAEQLNRHEIAYLHVIDGLDFGFHELGAPLTLREVREVFKGPLVGNMWIHQGNGRSCNSSPGWRPDRLRSALHQQSDLVERFANKWPLNPPADIKVWYSFDKVGYTSFPRYQISGK